jgi:hypothetical protein
VVRDGRIAFTGYRRDINVPVGEQVVDVEGAPSFPASSMPMPTSCCWLAPA